MKYSLLDAAGLCVNYTVWDGISDWQPPDGYVLASDSLQIGSRYEQDQQTGEWVLTESPAPPPPQPQWVQFGALLAADPSVNALVATAASTAPVLHLMLGVGLGQAAQGDAQTFSVAWSNALALGLISPELASHVAAIGASCDLPTEFLSQLNP
jgi:hypothetical protein